TGIAPLVDNFQRGASPRRYSVVSSSRCCARSSSSDTSIASIVSSSCSGRLALHSRTLGGGSAGFKNLPMHAEFCCRCRCATHDLASWTHQPKGMFHEFPPCHRRVPLRRADLRGASRESV